MTEAPPARVPRSLPGTNHTKTDHADPGKGWGTEECRMPNSEYRMKRVPPRALTRCSMFCLRHALPSPTHGRDCGTRHPRADYSAMDGAPACGWHGQARPLVHPTPLTARAGRRNVSLDDRTAALRLAVAPDWALGRGTRLGAWPWHPRSEAFSWSRDRGMAYGVGVAQESGITWRRPCFRRRAIDGKRASMELRRA